MEKKYKAITKTGKKFDAFLTIPNGYNTRCEIEFQKKRYSCTLSFNSAGPFIKIDDEEFLKLNDLPAKKEVGIMLYVTTEKIQKDKSEIISSYDQKQKKRLKN